MKTTIRSWMTSAAILLMLAAAMPLQGCAVLVGAAAGGAMGYALAYNGYEVQPPITRGDHATTRDDRSQSNP